MGCRLTAGVLNSAFIFLRKIDIRFIKTFIPIRTLSKAKNETLIMAIMIARNRFFLTDNIIYIMYIKKLHNFLKQINIDK